MNRLEELVEATKKVVPSSEEKEEQRRSFAYGNTNIENSRITRETVDKEAEALNSGERSAMRKIRMVQQRIVTVKLSKPS